MHIWGALTGIRFRQLVLEMLIALSLAFLVWLYTHSRGRETIDMVAIPVQVTLAPGTAGKYDLEINGPSRVTVTFSGPPSRIRELRGRLQRGAVQAALTVAVPEGRQKEPVYRETLEVQPTEIPVPAGVVAVVTEGLHQIPVTLYRLAERHLPVRLEYAGEPRVSQVKLEPATVLVRGPKVVLDRARSVPTQPYSPPPSWEGGAPPDAVVRGQATLVSELEGRHVQVTPATVSVRFRLHPRQKVYELTDVPVHFLCPPEFPWHARFAPEQPARVRLKVAGPAADEPPPVHAYVDLTQGSYARGRNTAPLQLQLPRDFQLAQDAPPRVLFHLEPIDYNTD
jgi:hypothetical protein